MDSYAAGQQDYFIVDARDYSTLEIAQTVYSDSLRQIDVCSGLTFNDRVLIQTVGSVKDQVYTIDISNVDYLVIVRHSATQAGINCGGKYRLLV